MATEAQRLVTITSPDPDAHPLLVKLGTFEVKSGGGAPSDTATYTPGGSQTPVVEGGRQTFDDVTCNRVWVNERDRPLIGPLLAARGGTRFNIADQPLDRHYNPAGDPIVWKGLLQAYNHPGADSESNNSARLELVFNIDGIAA